MEKTLEETSSIDPTLQCLIIPDPDVTHQRLVDIIYGCVNYRISHIIISDKPVPNEIKNTDKTTN